MSGPTADDTRLWAERFAIANTGLLSAREILTAMAEPRVRIWDALESINSTMAAIDATRETATAAGKDGGA